MLGSKEKAPLPAPLALLPPPTPPSPSTSTEHMELLLASGIQADEWMSSLKQEYKACQYFSDMLIVLGGGNQPQDDSETRRKQHAKRAKQFTLEDDGLIRQRATGKLGIPTSLRPTILQEAHDSLCKIFPTFHRAVWPVQVYNRLFKLARAQLRSKLNQ